MAMMDISNRETPLSMKEESKDDKQKRFANKVEKEKKVYVNADDAYKEEKSASSDDKTVAGDHSTPVNEGDTTDSEHTEYRNSTSSIDPNVSIDIFILTSVYGTMVLDSSLDPPKKKNGQNTNMKSDKLSLEDDPASTSSDISLRVSDAVTTADDSYSSRVEYIENAPQNIHSTCPVLHVQNQESFQGAPPPLQRNENQSSLIQYDPAKKNGQFSNMKSDKLSLEDDPDSTNSDISLLVCDSVTTANDSYLSRAECIENAPQNVHSSSPVLYTRNQESFQSALPSLQRNENESTIIQCDPTEKKNRQFSNMKLDQLFFEDDPGSTSSDIFLRISDSVTIADNSYSSGVECIENVPQNTNSSFPLPHVRSQESFQGDPPSLQRNENECTLIQCDPAKKNGQFTSIKSDKLSLEDDSDSTSSDISFLVSDSVTTADNSYSSRVECIENMPQNSNSSCPLLDARNQESLQGDPPPSQRNENVSAVIQYRDFEGNSFESSTNLNHERLRNNTTASPRNLEDNWPIPALGEDFESYEDVTSDNYETEYERRREQNGTFSCVWPVLFPCISCIFGMYNLSRIALMTITYKGPFVFQFLLLSVIIGMPFTVLMILLGQFNGSGLIQMWFVSPGFKGVGIALLTMYTMIVTYTSAPTSWIKQFLSDSIIKANDSYKWSNCLPNSSDVLYTHNDMDTIFKNVEHYYRDHVISKGNVFAGTFLPSGQCVGLIVAWALMIAIVTRGLKTTCFVISVIHLFGCLVFMIVTIKFIYLWGGEATSFINEDWSVVLQDPAIWTIALREVIFTWVMLGGVILHVCSHNKYKKSLRKFLVIFLSFVTTMLTLSIIFGACLGHGLKTFGVVFESNLSGNSNSSERKFVSLLILPRMTIVPHIAKNLYVVHQLVGDSYRDSSKKIHFFKINRIATELFPALVSVKNEQTFPSLLTSLFYIALLSLEFAQLLTIFMCLCDVIRQFKIRMLRNFPLSCIVSGISLMGIGLVFSSESGLDKLELVDFSVSSLFSVTILMSVLIFVLLLVRKDETTFRKLTFPVFRISQQKGIVPSILFYFWYFILPGVFLVISLIFMCEPVIGINSNWNKWSMGANMFALFLKLSPILIFIIYISIKIFLVTKSSMDLCMDMEKLIQPKVKIYAVSNIRRENDHSIQLHAFAHGYGNRNMDDQPPNYTPPPSYSKATAAIIALRLQRSKSLGYLEELSKLRETSSAETNLKERQFK